LVKLAVNYSQAAADLLEGGRIAFDMWKCPAWPDLIAAASQRLPVYVHLPLNLGAGIGDAVDGESGRPADWERIEALVAQTRTPLINVHLSPPDDAHPDIPPDSADPAHVERVARDLARDLCAVVARCGADRVIAENGGLQFHAALWPDVIRRVIEEAGCDFLLDITHVRLAANSLGMEEWAYLSALPLERTREIHVSGVQMYEGEWVARARRAGVGEAFIRRYAGGLLDHLPMTEEDWALTERALARVCGPGGASPGKVWVVSLEYGGVGPWFESVTDADALADAVPRLAALVRAIDK
jgi:uncharacterized protein (UPF0276 family)